LSAPSRSLGKISPWTEKEGSIWALVVKYGNLEHRGSILSRAIFLNSFGSMVGLILITDTNYSWIYLGTSPLGDPEKYCNWLLDIREKGVLVDWTWEWHAVSTRCGYHNQDAEIAYVDYTVQDLDDKRISRQDFYKKLFHVGK